MNTWLKKGITAGLTGLLLGGGALKVDALRKSPPRFVKKHVVADILDEANYLSELNGQRLPWNGADCSLFAVELAKEVGVAYKSGERKTADDYQTADAWKLYEGNDVVFNGLNNLTLAERQAMSVDELAAANEDFLKDAFTFDHLQNGYLLGVTYNTSAYNDRAQETGDEDAHTHVGTLFMENGELFFGHQYGSLRMQRLVEKREDGLYIDRGTVRQLAEWGMSFNRIYKPKDHGENPYRWSATTN